MTAWGEMTLGAWLWMGIWVVALVAMVWLLVRGNPRTSPADDAAAILRARFARGEIDAVQYRQACRLLGLEEEMDR